MCGIAGIVQLRGRRLEEPRRALAMAQTLLHRGPDAGGELLLERVAWGFRRLRVIDLETGEQPIANEDGSIKVMLNGEIYNYLELRARLEDEGHHFKTRSDTEVLVHGYEQWGTDLLSKLRGMFAFALWDEKEGHLLLARDRMGKKPLYTAFDGQSGELAFASEIKALPPWGKLDKTLDAEALDEYLTFLYLPGGRSIFRGVAELPPGSWLEIDCRAARPPEPQFFWQPRRVPERDGQKETRRAELRETLEEAVRLRLRSDVPIGAFLSSGIDSTLIAGIAARQLQKEGKVLETFTLGFADSRFDESAAAAASARRFGTLHHQEIFDSKTFSADAFGEFAGHFDEPFGDSSILPTYWLSRMARKKVTVALSGDGGDELFAGYNRYRTFLLLEKLSRLPGAAKSLGGALASQAAKFSRAAGLPGAETLRQAAKAFTLARQDRPARILGLLAYFSPEDKKNLLRPQWREKSRLSLEEDIATELRRLPPGLEPLEALLVRDLRGGLLGDGLRKVDRASMACSLEVRCPLLDAEVVELALRTPGSWKRQGAQGKLILKETFKEILTPEVLARPKKGFELPFAAWLARPDWRALLGDTFSEAKLQRQGIFESQEVLAWRDALLKDPEAAHLGISAYQLRHRVWALLVFQTFYDRYVDKA